MVLAAQLGSLVQSTVDARCLQMNVEHPDVVALDVDICPHGAVVGVFKENGLLPRNGITAVDDHILAAYCHIGEILLIAVRVLLVTADFVVFLQTEDVDLLSAHLGKDVLSHES